MTAANRCSCMRKFFLLLLLSVLILTGECFSQEFGSQVFHLKSITAQRGAILDKGWKFHAGDNQEWAKPDYDDKHWQSVNSTLQLHQLPAVQEAGIGWFRLKMKVDSSLMNERLAMQLNTEGASEIYLNGELIYRFGIVSADYEDELTRVITDRPFSLKRSEEHTSELQSQSNLVCRLLLEKKKKRK